MSVRCFQKLSAPFNIVKMYVRLVRVSSRSTSTSRGSRGKASANVDLNDALHSNIVSLYKLWQVLKVRSLLASPDKIWYGL